MLFSKSRDEISLRGVGYNIPDVKKQLKLDYEASSSINIK
jgi:hypothetical protein